MCDAVCATCQHTVSLNLPTTQLIGVNNSSWFMVSACYIFHGTAPFKRPDDEVWRYSITEWLIVLLSTTRAQTMRSASSGQPWTCYPRLQTFLYVWQYDAESTDPRYCGHISTDRQAEQTWVRVPYENWAAKQRNVIILRRLLNYT
jgi:hypothetical protein